MAIDQWVRLPSAWIDEKGLTRLTWKQGGEGADNVAALMALIAVAHNADQEAGVAKLTYNDICGVTGLSRSKLANGLEILKKLQIVNQGPDDARSTYSLASFGSGNHWAKLPAKSMYGAGRITAFVDFQLRRPAELDALKLFLLFCARRDRNTNVANIGYTKIEAYTDIKRVKLKAALSLLSSIPLVYVEQVPSEMNQNAIANAYRIVGIDSYNHRGTRGRGMTDMEATA